MPEFVIRRRIKAPRERVWEALLGLMAGADGQPEYEKPGDPAPHGPGAIKQLNLLGYSMREETVDLEPPHRRAYRMISGMPVDTYAAEATLEDSDGETELTWKAVIGSADKAVADDFAEKSKGMLEIAVRFVAERSEPE